MKQFSHSKLQVYERCPLQYKFQYLTNLKATKETTIEAFMGGCVHSVLELLYRDLQKTKLNSLEDLLKFYDELWRVEWNDEIIINNQEFTKKHYFDLGVKCIQNYYEKYYPFDQDQTLGVEKKINLKWGEVEIVGYVDRLSREKKGVYAIHDYKTGSMMEQEYADKDRQLALYSIAVKQTFKEAKKVKLIWHYVAYGEDIISERTNQQLQKLKENMLELIAEINQAEKVDNFPAKETKCEWCGFWEYCPKKKHLSKVEKLPRNQYLKDSGVKLANQYIELAEKKSSINKRAKTEASIVQNEIEKVAEAILSYANKHKVEVLQGNDMRVVVNKEMNYVFPTKSSDLEKYEKLENLLKKTKYWEAISSINGTKLEQLLEAGVVDKKLQKKISALVPIEESVSIAIRKNNAKQNGTA
jgi:putative RecB family exonuclease